MKRSQLKRRSRKKLTNQAGGAKKRQRPEAEVEREKLIDEIMEDNERQNIRPMSTEKKRIRRDDLASPDLFSLAELREMAENHTGFDPEV